MFDVGIVYERGGRLYLAVSDRLLLTVTDDGLQEIKPRTRLDYCENRKATVREIRQAWGISMALIDEITEAYMDIKGSRTPNRAHVVVDLMMMMGLKRRSD